MRLIRTTAASVLMIVGGAVSAGCGSDEPGDPAVTADCTVQLQSEGRTYTAFTTTETEPVARHAAVTIDEFHDVGNGHAGDASGAQADEVQARTFAGYDGDVVLGVPVAGSWQVFIESSVSRSQRTEIVNALQ